MQLIILWLILRSVTSSFVGFVSAIRPGTIIEQALPFLPPTDPLILWFERAFLSPWVRWDAEWYLRIITQGYSSTDGTAPFHPLYPWLALPLVKLGISPVLSLLIISSLAGITLLIVLNKLMCKDLKSEDAFFGILMFTLTPQAFILFAPYPEALFLLFAVLCIYWARKKSWWLAGIAGGLAVLTRQQGLFLFLPVAWELWEDAGRKPKTVLKNWKSWLSLSLIPLGMLCWLIYRRIFVNDLQINFNNLQTLIYSLFISPSATQVVPQQQFLFPWQAISIAFRKLVLQPDIDIWVNTLGGIYFLVLFALAWRNMRVSYRIYSLVITIVSFSFFTGSFHPYMGLLRHLLLAFPVFIGLAFIIKRPWIRLTIISLSALGMLFLLLLYVLKTWVP